MSNMLWIDESINSVDKVGQKKDAYSAFSHAK